MGGDISVFKSDGMTIGREVMRKLGTAPTQISTWTAEGTNERLLRAGLQNNN